MRAHPPPDVLDLCTLARRLASNGPFGQVFSSKRVQPATSSSGKDSDPPSSARSFSLLPSFIPDLQRPPSTLHTMRPTIISPFLAFASLFCFARSCCSEDFSSSTLDELVRALLPLDLPPRRTSPTSLLGTTTLSAGSDRESSSCRRESFLPLVVLEERENQIDALIRLSPVISSLPSLFFASRRPPGQRMTIWKVRSQRRTSESLHESFSICLLSQSTRDAHSLPPSSLFFASPSLEGSYPITAPILSLSWSGGWDLWLRISRSATSS